MGRDGERTSERARRGAEGKREEGSRGGHRRGARRRADPRRRRGRASGGLVRSSAARAERRTGPRDTSRRTPVVNPHRDSLGGVEKTLLINADEPEEVRVALLEDGRLEELYVEAGTEEAAKGNIYVGSVKYIERGIGAELVEVAAGRTGWVMASDIDVAV